MYNSKYALPLLHRRFWRPRTGRASDANWPRKSGGARPQTRHVLGPKPIRGSILARIVHIRGQAASPFSPHPPTVHIRGQATALTRQRHAAVVTVNCSRSVREIESLAFAFSPCTRNIPDLKASLEYPHAEIGAHSAPPIRFDVRIRTIPVYVCV
jgi:hypothetical protein